MSINRTLLVISNSIQNVTAIKWNKSEPTDFILKINTGTIQSIKIISKQVIEITFENATLLFDIIEDDLKKVIWDDLT